jgi:hypothetical protein
MLPLYYDYHHFNAMPLLLLLTRLAVGVLHN